MNPDSIHIIVRLHGTNYYLTAETRAAAELVRSALMLATPAATVEVWRGDAKLV
jgi:hypothetical protein